MDCHRAYAELASANTGDSSLSLSLLLSTHEWVLGPQMHRGGDSEDSQRRDSQSVVAVPEQVR